MAPLIWSSNSLYLSMVDLHGASGLLPIPPVQGVALLPPNLPLQMAFGLRRLVNTYSGCVIRVSRVSDPNVEVDIGTLPDGSPDEQGLLAFASGGSVDVMKWYSQVNGFDIFQSDPVKRGRIVDNGTIYKINNRPAIRFPFGGSRFDVDPRYLAGMSSGSRNVVFRQEPGSSGDDQGVGGIGRFTTSTLHTHMAYSNGTDYEAFLSAVRVAFPGYGPATAQSTANLVIHTSVNDGSTLAVYKNGAQVSTAMPITFTDTPSSCYLPDTSYGGISCSEYLIYNRAITAGERSAVERVLSNYYAISGYAAPSSNANSGELLTSIQGYTGPNLDLSAYQTGSNNYTQGPKLIPGGITFTSSNPYGSTLGQNAAGSSYDLGSNGIVDSIPVFAGLESSSGYMEFSFDAPVSQFGAYINYDPVSGANPIIECFDAAGHLLSSFDLATTTGGAISTPNGVNQFVFRGISQASAAIARVRFNNSSIVVSTKSAF